MQRRSFIAGLGALAALTMLPATAEPEAMPMPVGGVRLNGGRLYTVGQGQEFATLQEALDALYTDQGAEEFSPVNPHIGAMPS